LLAEPRRLKATQVRVLGVRRSIRSVSWVTFVRGAERDGLFGVGFSVRGGTGFSVGRSGLLGHHEFGGSIVRRICR
jgi:hypothetical protein